MVATVKLGLLGLAFASAGLACGQTARRTPDSTVPVLGQGGESGSGGTQPAGGGGGAQQTGGNAGAQQAGSGGGPSAAGAGGAESACVAFCTARQIHIEHCAERDGGRALHETFDACFQSSESSQFGLCPTDPSCGGWLAGCLSDGTDGTHVEAFPPNTNCTDSVAAKLFKPGS